MSLPSAIKRCLKHQSEECTLRDPIDCIAVENYTAEWRLAFIPTETNLDVTRFLRRVSMVMDPLTHWGRVTHICVNKLTIIDSDNDLSAGRHQAIIWTNAGILLIGPLGTKFSEISIGIQTFSFKKMHLNMSSAKWRPFCLGLNMLTHWPLNK